jgi:predicted nucleic acid-binding protein
MVRVLIDTDVILDFLLERPEFINDAERIWQAQVDEEFEGYISAITPINVFYIARKLKGANIAREAVTRLLEVWNICPLNDQILSEALSLQIKDFEDATQHAGANAVGVDFIVTRNLEDYVQSTIVVLSPAQFIEKL